jgi:hypothetical protein
MAQTTDNQPAPPRQAPPSQPAAQPQPDQQLMKPEQLEALVPPIALYPDECSPMCWRPTILITKLFQ